MSDAIPLMYVFLIVMLWQGLYLFSILSWYLYEGLYMTNIVMETFPTNSVTEQDHICLMLLTTRQCLY